MVNIFVAEFVASEPKVLPNGDIILEYRIGETADGNPMVVIALPMGKDMAEKYFEMCKRKLSGIVVTNQMPQGGPHA